MEQKQMIKLQIEKVEGTSAVFFDDQLAVEEPLQIVLQYSTAHGRMQKNIAVTMRTPGNDAELAAGFLITEAVVKGIDDIEEIKYSPSNPNNLLVILKENVFPSLQQAERNFYSTSSCGICGKASIEAVQLNPPNKNIIVKGLISAAVIHSLPGKLRKQQALFNDTGGIHACALFSIMGNMVLLREDVGRHNALDKLIGAALLNEIDMQQAVLLLSGRAGFELVQKAAMAGLQIVVAVGAPTSLAQELAAENNITLLGFARDNRFNIYSGKERIQVDNPMANVGIH